MIDIHNHILHGVDDGPKTLEESIELCRKLKDSGVRGIVATPHYISGDQYMPQPETIKKKVSTLQEILNKQDIKLEIYTGMEVFASHDTCDKLKSGEILTINDSHYILIEFSLNVVPKHALDLLFSIQVEGYTPIVAHPERYSTEFRKSALLNELVEKGVLLQINSGSVLGKHGKSAKSAAVKMLKEGIVHLVSSDSHGGRRVLDDCKVLEDQLVRMCGWNNARKIMYINPSRVIEDKETESMVKNKKFFFIGEVLKKLRLDI
jgi:protein-tyrosine phosphatase